MSKACMGMTIEQIQENCRNMAEELRNGSTIEAVAEKYHRTPLSVSSLCARFGIPTANKWESKRKSKNLTAFHKEMAELVRSGAMIEDVAEKYGLSPATVGGICHKAGVSTANKWKSKRARRKEGMTLGELLEWIPTQCNIDEKTGCLLWPRGQNGQGYAGTVYGGKTVLFHRLVCEKKYGVKLTENQCACHTCDVRNCVNPDHLFIGTKKDNADDRDRKGRNVNYRGEKHPNAKLKEVDVRQIKDLIRSGRMSLAEIGRQYGARIDTVWLIKTGKQWSSVV